MTKNNFLTSDILLLNVPFSLTTKWSTDLDTCKREFLEYVRRMKCVYYNRETDSSVKVYNWKIFSFDSDNFESCRVFASTCLLWDVVNTYGMLSIMYWNHGMLSRAALDFKRARVLLGYAKSLALTICSFILPKWHPSCMQVYYVDDNVTGSLGESCFPKVLVGNFWQDYISMCACMIQRSTIEFNCNNNSSAGLATDPATKHILNAKLALGGRNLANEAYLTATLPAVQKFFKNEALNFSFNTLFFWVLSTTNIHENGINGKRLSVLQLIDKEKNLLSSSNSSSILKLMSTEIEKWTKLNDSVYFDKIPTCDVTEEIIESLQPPRLCKDTDEELKLITIIKF